MNHLGHSTVSASLRYQHQVSGRDAEIAAALSALAAKPKLAVVTNEPNESVELSQPGAWRLADLDSAKPIVVDCPGARSRRSGDAHLMRS
jgi:hypothetical protein